MKSTHVNRQNVVKTITIVSLLTLFFGCAGVSKDGDQTVVATSTEDGSRPFWTFDGNYNQEKLRKEFDDQDSSVKNTYFVERAHVEDDETLVPTCYQIAKTRALGSIGSRISHSLKDSNVLGENQRDAAFERQLESQAKNTVVGAEQVNRAWLKTQNSKKENIISCWVVVAINKANVEKLEGYVMKKLERAALNDPAMRDKVHQSLEAVINNPGPTQKE